MLLENNNLNPYHHTLSVFLSKYVFLLSGDPNWVMSEQNNCLIIHFLYHTVLYVILGLTSSSLQYKINDASLVPCLLHWSSTGWFERPPFFCVTSRALFQKWVRISSGESATAVIIVRRENSKQGGLANSQLPLLHRNSSVEMAFLNKWHLSHLTITNRLFSIKYEV